MALVYNDGPLVYGSQVVNLSGTDYVAEDITFEETTKTIDRMDHLGNPNGAVYIKQKTTGSMTLQLATAATAIPELNTVVAMTFRGAPKNFIVTKVSQPFKQDDILKIGVDISEKLN